MKKLIPVTDSEGLKANGIFFTTKTLRKLHWQNKHPEIFLKISNRLFIDYAKWEDFIAAAEAERDRKIKKYQHLTNNVIRLLK